MVTSSSSHPPATWRSGTALPDDDIALPEDAASAAEIATQIGPDRIGPDRDGPDRDGPRDMGRDRPALAADDFINQLYAAHAVRMVRVAVLLLGDQPSAEDVVQEAFIALYRGLPRLRDRSKAVPYLRVAVVNGARSVLRGRKRAALRRVPYEPPVWSAESAAMVGEERRELLVAVAMLPGRQREVLALRYYLNLNDNEISTALGISRGTVSSTISRALAALARELKEKP
jgi:RNA polymerase sigma-70 factor (sigma-E family)